MTYQPIFPSGGNVGWTFLQRTRDDQQEAFNQSGLIAKNAEYFRENIKNIQSAEQLVADRRLLAVTLGAFGLDDDINNSFFVRKVLEEGTLQDTSFANRLADKRYFKMAETFAFDLTPPNTQLSEFADGIINSYNTQQFEVAVGNQSEDMRLALGFGRDIAELAERDITEETAWFTIMGTPPLRRVVELALGLPSEIGSVDIDRQLSAFQDRSERIFGTTDPADFANEGIQEQVIRNFLFRSELASNSASTSRGAVALSLLQSQSVGLFGI